MARSKQRQLLTPAVVRSINSRVARIARAPWQPDAAALERAKKKCVHLNLLTGGASVDRWKFSDEDSVSHLQAFRAAAD